MSFCNKMVFNRTSPGIQTKFIFVLLVSFRNDQFHKSNYEFKGKSIKGSQEI